MKFKVEATSITDRLPLGVTAPERGCVGAAVGAGQHRPALPAGALGHRAVSHHRAAAAVHLVIQAAGVT